MKVEVSLGEALDKYSILEIKNSKIPNEYITAELNALNECASYTKSFLYKILKHVNTQMWDLTETVKFSQEIYDLNVKRFRIKNLINLKENSVLKEQKSHGKTCCKIIIQKSEYLKLREINFLSIEYDYIFFSQPVQLIYPNIKECENYTEVVLDNFVCDDPVYDSDFIYKSGGKMGDFIAQLSIINEIYRITGKSGILYIYDRIHPTHKDDQFTTDLKTTYRDTYDLVTSQPYIKEYKMFEGQDYNLHLSEWRHYLNFENLFATFTKVFQVPMAKTPWLTIPENSLYTEKFYIITTKARFPKTIDYRKLTNLYNFTFLYQDPREYQYFMETTGLNIPGEQVFNFYDYCQAITSCKFLCTGLTASINIRFAVHKPILIGLPDDGFDYLNYGYNFCQGIYYGMI